MWSDRNSTLLVCFSRRESGVLCGELWSFFSEAPRAFRGLDQLLFAIEAALDEAGQQAAWCQLRFPAPPSGRWRPASRPVPRQPCYQFKELMKKRGCLCTGMIRICFRRNASIQGELCLLEPLRRMCFRSAMELISYLKTALEE